MSIPEVEASVQVVEELETKTKELEKANARIAELEQQLADQVKANRDMVENQERAEQQREEQQQRMEQQQHTNHGRVERVVRRVKEEASNVVIQEMTEMMTRNEEIIDLEVTETDVKMDCRITYKKQTNLTTNQEQNLKG